jgi:hypothetical protein
MSTNLQRNWQVLKLVASVNSPALRKKLLTQLCKSDDFLKALREICKNTVSRRVPLTTQQAKRLKRHKQAIFDLSDKKTPVTRRRKLAEQSGGAILPILIPIVASLLGEVLKSR